MHASWYFFIIILCLQICLTMLKKQNNSCEELYHEILKFVDNLQNNSGSNLFELCSCIADIYNANWDFQSLGNDSFDYFDKSCPENQILLETFNFQHNLVPISRSKIWIECLEWIWGLFWLLLIEVVGNGCLFTTIAYER